MAISKQKKQEIVKKVGDIIDTSVFVVFVRFSGLSVSSANEMRRALREQGVGYTVAKKTLVKRALKDRKIKGDLPELEGELALAYLPTEALAGEGGDITAPAKGIALFQKKFKDAVMPLGGVFEMSYLEMSQVKTFASIPSQGVLYGQLVTVINAPIQQTVQVLNGIAQSFVSVLHQIKEQKV